MSAEHIPAAASAAPGLLRPGVLQGSDRLAANQALRERSQLLLRRMNDDTVAADDHTQARDELIETHLPLAEHLARRFRNRGEAMDDLLQVARLGLVKAVDGFDPEREVEFSSYAIPTISGELKRHFRDKGWALRVPRRLKDLRLDVTQASLHLTQQLGRTPTVADMAEALEITEAEVREALACSVAYSASSLSAPVGGTLYVEGETTLGDTLGGPDESLQGVEDRETLRPLLRQLAPRERRIIGMRFYENMTQSQIAAKVGISQMHVSRLLSRSLRQMREGLVTGV